MQMEQKKCGSVLKSYRKERITEWEKFLKTQSSSKPVQCRKMPLEATKDRTMEQFSTGSKYEGSWDELGMSGLGRYIFPNGVVYAGEFLDGMFEGAGELVYQDGGAVLRGRWHRVKLLERTLIFADGMEYKEENWGYCTMPDRRFTVEHSQGLQAAGATHRTAAQPTPDLPPGHLDTVDGFYDPRIKMVMRPDDISQILRAPGTQEQAWIEAHCRRRPMGDEPVIVGARADLYETWEEPRPLPLSAAASAAASSAAAATATAADDDTGPCAFCHPCEDDLPDLVK